MIFGRNINEMHVHDLMQKEKNAMKTKFSISALIFLALVLGLVMPNLTAKAADVAYTVCGSGCDYTTVQAAILAVRALPTPAEMTTYTISVKAGTYDETTTIDILQQEYKNIVLQAEVVGGSYAAVTLKDQIRIDGGGRFSEIESVTLQGFSYDLSAAGGSDAITTADVDSSGGFVYSHNIYIKDSSFTGDIGDVAVRAAASGGHVNYWLENLTATGLHSLGQFTSVTLVTVKDCIVSGGKSGVNLTGTIGDIDNLTYTGISYGIRTDSNQTIKNSSLISSGDPTDLSDPDTALVLRYDTVKTITIENSTIQNTNNGYYDIANTTGSTASNVTLNIDGVNWGNDGMLLGGLTGATLNPVHNRTQNTWYTTIQAGVTDANAGDTIAVAAGTYAENVIVDEKITLQGAGSDASGTVIDPVSGIGITLAASGTSTSDRLVIKDLRVQDATNGIQVDSTVSFVTFDNVASVNNSGYGIEIHNSAVITDLILNNMIVSGNSVGLRSATSGSVNGLTITGGSFDGNTQGICIFANSGSTSNQNHFTNISITGTTFNNNTLKGMYFEKLDHATFTDITVNNSGTSGSFAAGIDINLKYGAYQNISILNSTISNSGTGDPTNGVGLTIKARDDAPSYSGNPATLSGVTVTGGALTGNQTGLRFGEPGKNNAGPTTVTVSLVNISGNLTAGIDNQTVPTQNATPNRWGSVNGPSAGQIIGTGAVTYIPWCTNVECTTFGGPVHNVTRDTWFGTIQAAIDDTVTQNGDVIAVSSGTFVENVVVTKSLSIGGTGTSTIVMPAISNPNCGGAGGGSLCGSNVFLVQANNVVIHDLTVDGDNPTLSSGSLYDVGGANLDARNGIITNHAAGVFNDLEVHHVTVKNIYLRGIYPSSEGTFNIHNNTINNTQADDQSFAIMVYGGTGIVSDNTVDFGNAVGANYSKGTQWLHNILTNTAGGIHTDNNSGVADVIHGNSVDCTGLSNGWGVWVFNPSVNVSVDQNTVTNCDIGMAMAGGAGGIPTFTANTVDGQSKSNSFGVYITTSLFGWGSADVNASFLNNFIKNNDYSIEFESETDYNLTATISNNSITGNINGIDVTTGGTFAVNASGNWWGSNLPATVKASANGGTIVDYTPWLNVGTDMGDPGFQGNFSNLWVDDDSPQTGTAGHIQEGINLVLGSTVNVAAGTYNEKVVISKALTLQGAGAATTIIDGTGLAANPLVVISAGAGNVKFDGFTVQNGGVPGGTHFQMTLGGGNPGDIVTITNNIIIGSGDDANDDYGMYATSGLSDLVFSGNTVSNCGYHGIFFERYKGATNIFSNNFTSLPVAGPVIGFMTYENPLDPAGSQDITTKQWVHDNTIDANGASGILFMAPFGWSYNQYKGGSFTNIEISGNTITNVGDSGKGIQLEVDGDTGGILNTVISNNVLSTQNPGAGTSRGIRLLGKTTNTSITGNTISKFYRGVYQSYSFGVAGTGPTGTVLRSNKIAGNAYFGVENQYTGIANIIDATSNWWGSASGPYDNKTLPNTPNYNNPLGAGDAVSAYVDYDPWCTNETCTIEQPPLPSSFWGYIHFLDGAPTSSSILTAEIDGLTGPAASVTLTDPTHYAFNVPGDLDGTSGKEGGVEDDIITFKIDGRVVANGVWHAGTNVELDFHPPQALPGGPYDGLVSTPISLSGSVNDWFTPDTFTYAWDLDNNGSYETPDQNISPSWPTAGAYTIGLQVTDSQGGVGTATTTVYVQTTCTVTNLVAGWNLVSLCLAPVNTAPGTVLNSLSGSYDLLYGWDGSQTPGNNWLKFAPGGPGYANNMTSLDETMGFWVHMTVPGTLTVTGYPPATTDVPLSTVGGGWNLVGYPSLTPWALPGTLHDFTLIYAYHAADSADPWKLFDISAPSFVNDLTSLTVSWGYWIKVTSSYDWTVTY
jgi:hypothetical protein